MKRLYFILLSFAFIISVFSCKKSEIEDGYGYLSVNLDEDDTEEIVFKSSPEADQIFSITVYNSLQQKVAFVEDYRTLGNEGIVLVLVSRDDIVSDDAVVCFADAVFRNTCFFSNHRSREVVRTDIVFQSYD